MDKTQKLGQSVDAELKRRFKPENVDAVRNIVLSMAQNMSPEEKALAGAQLVPGVGDVAGLAMDAKQWVADREAGQPWDAEDYALAGAGLLPVVPSLSILRGAKKGAKAYNDALYRSATHGSGTLAAMNVIGVPASSAVLGAGYVGGKMMEPYHAAAEARRQEEHPQANHYARPRR